MITLDPSIEVHLRAVKTQQCDDTVFAFFDMDRTLIQGYSAFAFAVEALRQRLPGGARIAREMLLQRDSRRGAHYSGTYRQLLGALAGTPVARMEALGQAAFARSLSSSLYREARQIIRQHQALGHRVVIVSAATQFQVEPVAAALGVDEIACTRLRVREGCLTGEVEGTLCLGEAKLTAARRMTREAAASLQDAWFYSDSRDDLPLLKKVGHPVATNPSAPLQQIAVAKSWPVLNFCSRGKPNLESILRTALMAGTLASTAIAGVTSRYLDHSPQKTRNVMATCLGGLGSAFAGLEFEVEGTEHLDAVRPAIFTFNHQSFLDSIVMAQLLRHDFVAFCKKEVAQNRILGPLLRAHGTIFVDREAADQSLCLEQAREALKSGKSLVIAPEGTRSASGELSEFKSGAFYLARKMRVPIIPVVLHNVADALPKGRFLLRPAVIQVTVLPPVYAADLGQMRTAGQRLRARYQQVLEPLNAAPAAIMQAAEEPGMSAAAR